MKKTLKEELERIHSLTYGSTKSVTIVEGIFESSDDEKKADEVTGEVNDFFNSLSDVKDQGGLSQEERGSMEYKKGVETLQIGLILLGYELPRFGVDGLFGPETASAVNKFGLDNNVESSDNEVTASPELIEVMIEKLKSLSLKDEDIKPHTNQMITADVSLCEKSSGVEIAKYLISKGYTTEHAAGIAGNIYVESGYKTGAIGDSGTSYGLVQWHNERWDRLKEFCEKNNLDSSSVEGQLIYLDWELKTSEKKARTELMRTDTPSESAYAFAKYFERPSKISPKRMEKAEEIYKQLA